MHSTSLKYNWAKESVCTSKDKMGFLWLELLLADPRADGSNPGRTNPKTLSVREVVKINQSVFCGNYTQGRVGGSKVNQKSPTMQNQ